MCVCALTAIPWCVWGGNVRGKQAPWGLSLHGWWGLDSGLRAETPCRCSLIRGQHTILNITNTLPTSLIYAPLLLLNLLIFLFPSHMSSVPSGLFSNFAIPSTQSSQVLAKSSAPYTSSMGCLIFALHLETSRTATRSRRNPCTHKNTQYAVNKD